MKRHRRFPALLTVCLASLLAIAPPPAVAQDEESSERLQRLIEESVQSAGSGARNDRLSDTDSVEDARVARQIRTLLRSRRVTVNLDDVPLLDALELFGDLTGLNLVVSPSAREAVEDDDSRVKLRLRDVRAESLLRLMLDSHRELVYGVRHGVMQIALDEELLPRPVLHIYPVDDLLREPRDFPAPRLDLGGLEGS